LEPVRFRTGFKRDYSAGFLTNTICRKSLLFEASQEIITVLHQLEWIANSLKERDMKRSSIGTKRTGGKRKPTGSQANQEVVAFVAAVLRQMDHAANLVVAFFRSIGMMGPRDAAISSLPSEFLLELAALLQLRDWHAAGLIDWSDPEGLSIDDMIGWAIGRLHDDPAATTAERRGTEAMTDVLQIWTETCAPDARSHLAADVAIRWDNSVELDSFVDNFATFLCRHRNAGEAQETI